MRRLVIAPILGTFALGLVVVAVVAAVVVPSIGTQLKAGDESRIQQDLTSLRSASGSQTQVRARSSAVMRTSWVSRRKSAEVVLGAP